MMSHLLPLHDIFHHKCESDSKFLDKYLAYEDANDMLVSNRFFFDILLITLGSFPLKE